MRGPLRHIALTVEQAPSGGYHWLLLESSGGKLFVLERALRANPTYLRALQEGFEHLALLSASGLCEQNAKLKPGAPPYPRVEEQELHHAL